MMRKRSVAVAIHKGSDVLIVQRPADDEELPNMWGLPAASLRDGESWHDAVRRAGREKLGVELRVGDELNHGRLSRGRYELEMKLFGAEIVAGEPVAPQSDASVTQYQGWKWGGVNELQPGAEAGSLCCRLLSDQLG